MEILQFLDTNPLAQKPVPPVAVPFEEDERDPSIWFLDHSYLEELFNMFRRVNGVPSPPPQRHHPPTSAAPSRPRRFLQKAHHSSIVPREAAPVRTSQDRAVQRIKTRCAPAVLQPRRRWWAGTTRGRGCGSRTWTSRSSWPATATTRC